MFLDEIKRPFVVMVKIAMITKNAIYMPYSRIFCWSTFCAFLINDTLTLLSRASVNCSLGKVITGANDVGHHPLVELVNVTGDGTVADLAPVAQHHHSVAHRVDIFQAVTDDDDRTALRLELPHQIEYLANGRHTQGRRGLIHDDDLGVESCRAGNGHRLALAPGQTLHLQAHGGDVNLETIEQALRLLLHVTPVHHTDRAELCAHRFTSQE